jgi:hypothetical protein
VSTAEPLPHEPVSYRWEWSPGQLWGNVWPWGHPDYPPGFPCNQLGGIPLHVRLHHMGQLVIVRAK